eukprot:1161244-Pelagomonas_calceolata.AAC.24
MRQPEGYTKRATVPPYCLEECLGLNQESLQAWVFCKHQRPKKRLKMKQAALYDAMAAFNAKVQPSSATVAEFVDAAAPLVAPIDAYFEKVCVRARLPLRVQASCWFAFQLMRL